MLLGVSLGIVLFSVFREIMGHTGTLALPHPQVSVTQQKKVASLRGSGSQPVGYEPLCLRLRGKRPSPAWHRILLTGIALYFSLEVRF